MYAHNMKLKYNIAEKSEEFTFKIDVRNLTLYKKYICSFNASYTVIIVCINLVATCFDLDGHHQDILVIHLFSAKLLLLFVVQYWPIS
jgi:hypothetical protein